MGANDIQYYFTESFVTQKQVNYAQDQRTARINLSQIPLLKPISAKRILISTATAICFETLFLFRSQAPWGTQRRFPPKYIDNTF